MNVNTTAELVAYIQAMDPEGTMKVRLHDGSQEGAKVQVYIVPEDEDDTLYIDLAV